MREIETQAGGKNTSLRAQQIGLGEQQKIIMY